MDERLVRHPRRLETVGRHHVLGLEAWPAVGEDVEAHGLGVCAGTWFNTPAAANRIGLRVAYVATIGNDMWSRMIGRADGEVRSVPADPVEVVDTAGAGDCFNAGFLAGWLDGLSLEPSLTLGVICGSRAVGDYGGYRGCPREPELRAIAAARGIRLPVPSPVPGGDPA